MLRVASLPMYPVPPGALAAFWRGLAGLLTRAGLAGVPDRLDDPADLPAHWRAPNLLLSQTCGYPLTTTLRGAVRYVGTPAYRAEGCTGALYSSAIVVRAADDAADLAALRGRCAAYNSRDSQSGYNALRALVAPLSRDGRFFAETIETGAHRRSIAAVRSGAADVAAIDAVSWALLERDHPDEAAGLRLLGFTAPVPGLPIVTAAGTSDDDLHRLRIALHDALTGPALADLRRPLLLDGFEVLPPAAYDVIPAMEAEAVALAYPDVA